MNPEELIGGHAPGNLTPEEKRKLYRAALTDQAVFDALMAEEPLRELLDDPESRGYVQAALEETPRQRFPYWMAAGLALLCVIAASVWWRVQESGKVAVSTEVAMVKPEPVPVQEPAGAAAPAPMKRPQATVRKTVVRPGPVAAPPPPAEPSLTAEARLENKAEAEAPVPVRIVRVGAEPADAKYRAGQRILLRLPGPVAVGQRLILSNMIFELRPVENEWEAGPIELRKGEFIAVLSPVPSANEFAKSVRQRAADSSADRVAPAPASSRPGSAQQPLIRFTVE
jgi:hypothetical protein